MGSLKCFLYLAWTLQAISHSDGAEYGNHIVKRMMPGQEMAPKSFVDTEVTIPGPGRLMAWNMFVTYNPEYPEVLIWMQIWRKIDRQDKNSTNFELLYQERFNLSSQDQGKIQLKPTGQFEFDTDVHYGWTLNNPNGSVWIPINFEFNVDYNVHFLNLNSQRPFVGEVYTFGKLPYPAKFSVGVTVQDQVQRQGQMQSAELCSSSENALNLSCPTKHGLLNPIYIHLTRLVNTEALNCGLNKSQGQGLTCGDTARVLLEACHGHSECTIDGNLIANATSRCAPSENETSVLSLEYSCMRDLNTYGRETIRRTNAGISSRARTFVDDQVPIEGPGKLLAWNLFVVSGEPHELVPVYLQLWEPVTGDFGHTFRLLHETKYEFNSSDSGTLTVPLETPFEFGRDVRLGISIHDPGWIPVSFEYQASQDTYFRNIDESDKPLIGQKYSFGFIPLPAVFSFSVLTDKVVGAETIQLPLSMETTGHTLNVFSPAYPDDTPETQQSYKCIIIPVSPTNSFTVRIQEVLLELGSTSTACEESLLIYSGKNFKSICSGANLLTVRNDPIKIEVNQTLQMIYRKASNATGGRFWLKIEGFKENARIDLNFTTEEVTWLDPTEENFAEIIDRGNDTKDDDPQTTPSGIEQNSTDPNGNDRNGTDNGGSNTNDNGRKNRNCIKRTGSGQKAKTLNMDLVLILFVTFLIQRFL